MNSKPPTKQDAGKPQLNLVPSSLLFAVGAILTFGAKKYAPNAWRDNPMDWNRIIAALNRHWFAWLDGEDCDPETGMSHLWHVGCNVAFLIEYEQKGLGTDGRWKRNKDCVVEVVTRQELKERSKPYKTLHDCFKEAGKQFPFKVTWLDNYHAPIAEVVTINGIADNMYRTLDGSSWAGANRINWRLVK